MLFSKKSNITTFALLFIIQLQLHGQVTTELPQTYLSTSTDNVVFDMSMSYKDYYGSGLLVLKRESKSNYHGVFLSKVGLKLMEFRIIDGVFEWVKLLAFFDKRTTRKMMERDFSMLMLSDIDNLKKVKKINPRSGLERFKIWSNNKLVVGVNDGKIVYSENRKILNFTKTKITYLFGKNNTPKSVSLAHRTIKVILQLELLEQ